MSKKRSPDRKSKFSQHSKKKKSAGRVKGLSKKPGGEVSSKPTSGEQVEGRQAVRELLLAGSRNTVEIFLADDLKEAEILSDIRDIALSMSVPVRTVSRSKINSKALTSSHQGVIAKADAMKFANFDELIADPNAFLLVLDGITDPVNLGSMLRIAECAGVTGIILPGRRSVTITPTVSKTAAGALEHVPIAIVGGVATALSEMKKANITTIGLDAAGKHGIFDSSQSLSKPIALVLGKEGSGLSRLVMERVDTLVSIPLLGELNSLNVAMATAISCFEIVRRQLETTNEPGNKS